MHFLLRNNWPNLLNDIFNLRCGYSTRSFFMQFIPISRDFRSKFLCCKFTTLISVSLWRFFQYILVDPCRTWNSLTSVKYGKFISLPVLKWFVKLLKYSGFISTTTPDLETHPPKSLKSYKRFLIIISFSTWEWKESALIKVWPFLIYFTLICILFTLLFIPRMSAANNVQFLTCPTQLSAQIIIILASRYWGWCKNLITVLVTSSHVVLESLHAISSPIALTCTLPSYLPSILLQPLSIWWYQRCKCLLVYHNPLVNTVVLMPGKRGIIMTFSMSET